jgi:hypothetical protein
MFLRVGANAFAQLRETHTRGTILRGRGGDVHFAPVFPLALVPVGLLFIVLF